MEAEEEIQRSIFFRKNKIKSSRHSVEAMTSNRAWVFQYVTLPGLKTDESIDNRYLDHTPVLPGSFL